MPHTFLTLTPSAPYHSFTLSVFSSISLPLSLSLPFVVFVWLLGFVCLLFPDGRRRLHLCGFQVPRELFTALAQALILFPLAGLYDGPFISSNWKQLSLPVCVGERGKKAQRKCRFDFIWTSSLETDKADEDDVSSLPRLRDRVHRSHLGLHHQQSHREIRHNVQNKFCFVLLTWRLGSVLTVFF